MLTPAKTMTYAEIMLLPEEECFPLISDSPVAIAKRVFLKDDRDTFSMIEVHPTRRFSVRRAKAWLAGHPTHSLTR